MEVSNKIQDTNIGIYLKDKKCADCCQVFTEEELRDSNFEIWWNTSDNGLLRKVVGGDWQFDNGIKHFTHRQITSMRLIDDNPRTEQEWKYFDCPAVMKCENCYGKFLEKELTADNEWGMIYYCSPCWKERNKEKEHE